MIRPKGYSIPPGSLESFVKDRIKQYFHDNNIWFKMPQPSHIGNTVGMSDFLALHNGIFIAVEAKANRKESKPSSHQEAYLNDVNHRGGIGMIVRCEDDIRRLDEVLGEAGAWNTYCHHQ